MITTSGRKDPEIINLDWTFEDGPAEPARQTDIVIFFSAFALCLLFRLPTLGHLAFWFDEVITAEVISLPWHELIVDRLASGHFPTYFALLKILGLSGGSEFTLRLPSAIFDSAAGGIVAMIGWRLGGRLVAVFSALLYAMLPCLIIYGQEARPYALLLFFVALAMFGQIPLLMGRPHGTRHVVLATIGTLGAILTIPAGAIPVIVQHVAILLSGFRDKDPSRRRQWTAHFAATWIGGASALLLLIPTIVRQRATPGGLLKWQSTFPFKQRFDEMFDQTYGFVVVNDMNRFVRERVDDRLAFMLLLLIAIGFLAHRRSTVHRYLAWLAIGTPIVFLGLATFSASSARYLTGMLPAATLLAATGATALLRYRWTALLAVAVLTAFVIAVLLQALDTAGSPRKYDWRPIAIHLHKNGVRDTVLLSDAPQISKTFNYYAPAEDHLSYQTINPSREPIETLWTATVGRPIAWMVLTGKRSIPPEIADGTTVCTWPFGEMKIVMVARDPAAIPPDLQDCARPSAPSG